MIPNTSGAVKIMVVGAGQSAAEVAYHLLKTFPAAEVHVIARGFAFRSIDASPLTNELFTGPASERFFELSPDERNALLSDLTGTNYSVVDEALIASIARLMYEDRVEARTRLYLHSFSELVALEDTDQGMTAYIRSQFSGSSECVRVDSLCYATGYEVGNLSLLDDILPYARNRELALSASYRVNTVEQFHVPIYLQGAAQQTHGFTEGTVADLPWRASRILADLRGRISADDRSEVAV
jgi:L-ornithine N5-oxygenase